MKQEKKTEIFIPGCIEKGMRVPEKYSKTCLSQDSIVPGFFFRFHRFPFYTGLCFKKKYKGLQ
jgi:hypothetical protein